MSISIHNSARELAVTPENVDELGASARTFTAADGGVLPYREWVTGSELPGAWSLLIFLHGVGSVGTDNYLQMRIPGPPFARYFASHQVKAVVLFPQCAKGFQWVDVPWSAAAHDMPIVPSVFMRRLLELFACKQKEYGAAPERTFAGGISMGGYGAWDLVSRRPEAFGKILAICGGADVGQAAKLAHLHVYDIHGDHDPAVPVSRSRDMVRALREAGASQVVYREIPGGVHNVWDRCFADDEALDFLFA